MDQSRENSRPAPPSMAAAANTSAKGSSRPAVTPFQFNKEGEVPIQRYAAATLDAQRTAIEAATGSGQEILAANKAAQAALAADGDSANKKLTTHFTSMGIESEFAEQPLLPASGGKKAKPQPPKNALSIAHIIVSEQGGYALYPDLKFLLETDAGNALEFVTAPLLAPVRRTAVAGDNETAAQNVIPDPTWEKNARKGIEKSLRDISSSGTHELGKIVTKINEAFSLELPAPDGAYEKIKYGDIENKSAGSYTNVQLNYMTTLQHFMDVNRGTAGDITGDAKAEAIYTLAMTAGTARGKPTNAYVYALCQKLREIPSMLVDETFSVILHSDNKPAEIVKKGEKGWVKTAKDEPSFRQKLSLAASHIKDSATLWLKASFDQILMSIPADKYDDVYDIMSDLHAEKSKILGLLKTTSQVDALKNFHNESVIDKFITDQIDRLNDLPAAHQQHEIVSDIGSKPAEQKTISAERRRIRGGRPDTYIPVDTAIGAQGQSLFLVETRNTASYLGLKKEDAYGYKGAPAPVPAVVAAPLAGPQQPVAGPQPVVPLPAAAVQVAGPQPVAAGPAVVVPARTNAKKSARQKRDAKKKGKQAAVAVVAPPVVDDGDI